jgi:molecular chaperone DnaK
MSKKILGIDLGTTNSCAAVIEGGSPKVVLTQEGTNTTPSIVAFTDKERLVGHSAKRQAVTNPQNTLYSTKRLIGKKFTEAEKENEKYPLAYAISAAANGDAWIATQDGKKMSPSEIGAAILTKVVSDAEAYLGYKCTDVVITVPAYFNDAQRQATKDAGAIAGLNVLRIINEPTAAALAYGLDKQSTTGEKIVVYDLGGGTFDVSVLEIKDGVFEVLSTNGNTHLGGDDFDNRIIKHLITEFKKESGIDLSTDEMALQRLKEESEKAKVALSSSTSFDIRIPFISGSKHLNISITRKAFEALINDLVESTLTSCHSALKDANLKTSDINKVLLVGGSTRVPKIKEAVKQLFGENKVSSEVNPDEAVAIGAAVQGAILSGDVKDILLLDVTPLSLGIETMGGVLTKLIERNSTIPTKKSQIFSTAADNQTSVSIRVFQGERAMAIDNKLLGNFDLHGIPPAPRGVPQVEVAFDINANGILEVSAKELTTGKVQNITIQGSSGLSKEEIEKMQKESEKFADEDKKKIELIELRNRSDNLIYTTEKALTDHKDKISEEIKTAIDEKLKKLQEVLPNGTFSEVEEAYNALSTEAQKIYEAMNAQNAQNHQQNDQSQENVNENASQDGENTN